MLAILSRVPAGTYLGDMELSPVVTNIKAYLRWEYATTTLVITEAPTLDTLHLRSN